MMQIIRSSMFLLSLQCVAVLQTHADPQEGWHMLIPLFPTGLEKSWAVLAAVSKESGFSVSAEVFTVCPAAGVHAEPITLHKTLVFPAHCHPREQTQQEGEGDHAGALPSHCHRGTPGTSAISVTSFLLCNPLCRPMHTLCMQTFQLQFACTTYRNTAFIFNLNGVIRCRVLYKDPQSIQDGSGF